jgi:FtsZ-interacting cell division protein ZipA
VDASSLRWVLAIIGIVLLAGIYLFGLHQSRLRKRAAVDTFTREEIDSAFIEDEQLREELDNLNQIMNQNDLNESYDQIKINPAIEANLAPVELPKPELFIADVLADIDEHNLISYLLKHTDHRLITGEEIENAIMHSELEINAEGYLEYRQLGELYFTIASLSSPGHFFEVDQLEFNTLGLNCFIDLKSNHDPEISYELMLKKIDELVRLLGVKVYQSNHELLTISNVTQVRQMLKGD